MTDKSGSEPAFPRLGTAYSPGMTLRQWFAGMAMMGYLSSDRYGGNLQNETCAKEAYCMADAMLKEGAE